MAIGLTSLYVHATRVLASIPTFNLRPTLTAKAAHGLLLRFVQASLLMNATQVIDSKSP